MVVSYRNDEKYLSDLKSVCSELQQAGSLFHLTESDQANLEEVTNRASDLFKETKMREHTEPLIHKALHILKVNAGQTAMPDLAKAFLGRVESDAKELGFI